MLMRAVVPSYQRALGRASEQAKRRDAHKHGRAASQRAIPEDACISLPTLAAGKRERERVNRFARLRQSEGRSARAVMSACLARRAECMPPTARGDHRRTAGRDRTEWQLREVRTTRRPQLCMNTAVGL